MRVGSSASVKAGSGDLDLAEIGGEVSVRIGSGDIRLRQLGGSAHVATGSGDINLESAIEDGAEWVFKAGSGDVDLILPGGSRFNLSARSVLGEIQTDFGLRASGGIGKRVDGKVGEDPASSITVRTAHGDVRIAAENEPVAAA